MAAAELGNEMKTLNVEVSQCMKAACDLHMDQATNLPDRLFIQSCTFHDDDFGGPKFMLAEIDMKNLETARAIICGTFTTTGGVTYHGYLDGTMVGWEAFFEWRGDVGANYTL
jgi:hypothetical protein